MILHSYTCPECDGHSSTVDGQPIEGGVVIKCPACGHVEEIRRQPSTGGVAS